MDPIVTLTMNPALDIATTTESIVPGHKLRCEVPRYDPGGGGINVARAVHALGGDSLAIFPAGGPAGAQISRLLDAEGVAHQALPISGFTRESLNVEERTTGNQYRFILPGPELTPCETTACLIALRQATPRGGYVVASGSLPLGVPADFYARVGATVRDAGARFVLDTSGPALSAAGGNIYLVKPSLRELEELSGRNIATDADQERAALKLIARGIAQIVVVSLGAAGALLAISAGVERFAAVPVEAQSTVGAGDSMLAGILVALARGWNPSAAVRYGIAAGAAAMLGRGTQLCRREDVERLYAAMAGGGAPAAAAAAPAP
jgi:6-phosphofructokinase 2